MPGTRSGATLQVLAASATQHDGGKWKLYLLKSPETFDSVSGFNDFAKGLSLNQGEELVLFIRASVTSEDFLVVGEDAVPERNLLSSVLDRADSERRVFFFTADCLHGAKLNYAISPAHTLYDRRLMKGVTLYRLASQSDGIPVDLIKEAAGISGTGAQAGRPDSALDFYNKLNKDSERRVVMVPSGKTSAANRKNKLNSDDSKVDFALLLTHPNFSADANCCDEFCKNLKNVELTVSEVTKDATKKEIRKLVSSFAAKISRNPESVGRIWLFVSSHGTKDGIALSLNKEATINLKELTKSLFKNELADKSKVLVIDACRGAWPEDNDSQADSSENQSNFGLMFRNQTGNDPWSVSGLGNCLTLFGALPGFKSYVRDAGKASDLFTAMEKAAKELNDLKASEELHEFVQRIQGCVNAPQNPPKQLEASPGVSHETQEIDGQNLEENAGSGVTVTQWGQVASESVTGADMSLDDAAATAVHEAVQEGSNTGDDPVQIIQTQSSNRSQAESLVHPAGKNLKNEK